MRSTFSPKPRTNIRRPSEKIPIPDLNKAKAEYILERLEDMNGKLTSTFDEETQMLVEMLFRRTLVDNEGKPIPIANWPTTRNKQRALVLHSWAIPFLISVVQRPLAIPRIIIYEDKDIDFLALNKDCFVSTNSPMVDALNSWPDKYLPIRTSKGQRAASFSCKTTSRYQVGDEVYSVKDNFFGTEEASLTTPAFIPEQKVSRFDRDLQRPWAVFSMDLRHDVVRGLKYPEEFKQHFKTDFDLTSIEIPPGDKEMIEKFLNSKFVLEEI